jgi:hypothetical protein
MVTFAAGCGVISIIPGALKNMAEILKDREVIFEFRPVGNIMRVTAMDTETMTEIAIQCPVSAGEAVFKANALKRLEFVLRKNKIIT